MSRQFEFPILPPIRATRADRALIRAWEKDRLEVLAQMEADRVAMRRARSQDPHQCHCPRCYVIGG